MKQYLYQILTMAVVALFITASWSYMVRGLSAGDQVVLVAGCAEAYAKAEGVDVAFAAGHADGIDVRFGNPEARPVTVVARLQLSSSEAVTVTCKGIGPADRIRWEAIIID
ncbi:MAG: hypothetical protein ACPGOV_06790 [Magnetovibrionaceae bacterium]